MDPGLAIKLGGLDVEFPYKPYGIQRAMMARIIVAYTNKQNCLIESPTGTGKSLSLICSSLAWQQRSRIDQRPFVSASFKEKQVKERMALLRKRPCTCGARPDALTELDELKNAKKGQKVAKDTECKILDDESALKKVKLSPEYHDASPYFQKPPKQEPQTKESKSKGEPEFITIDSDDDDVNATQIISPSKYSDMSKKDGKKMVNDVDVLDQDEDKFRKPLSVSETNKGQSKDAKVNEKCQNCLVIETEENFIAECGPTAMKAGQTLKKIRIYYGTRTHKQITQIVRELKKTTYTKDLRMNILSSRDRTCINEDVMDRADRNDKCKELVKNKSKATSMANRKTKEHIETCLFYRESNQMTAEFPAIYDEQPIFDIEDAVVWSKKTALCPYFGLRALQDEADITFCPYNYILDSNIRSAMNINLKNSIIILDEAHNIEDICRDSASFIINTQQLDDILSNINTASFHYTQGSQVRDAYDFFKNLLTDLKAALLKFDFGHASHSNDGDCIARKVLMQQDMMNQLTKMGFGPNNLGLIRDYLKVLKGDDDDNSSERSGQKDDQDAGALNNNDLQVLTQLTHTLEFIYLNDSRNNVDYRCIIAKLLNQTAANNRYGKSAPQPKTDTEVHIYQFSLMCMNPAIAFKSIHQTCWSVVVASGTLSPIESLKTELGCTFSQVFEGSHVIPDDRIFATILSSGPNRIDLNCSYANSLRLDFQDELGQVVRDVCRTVPNGVLIFFPSYDRMENLYQRWFTKGYISEIMELGKKIHREQKKFTAIQFDAELKKYHNAASRKGAVMMAVYRGKISEGIDFSDSAARAVISIGIPFPNVKEITINLKKEYNDQVRRTKNEIMSGTMWYQTQAMRALNQSLGRVIRHKEDWGAIIMLDSRLKSPQNVCGISKWVRRCINTPDTYDIFKASLQDFVALRQGDQMD